MSVKNGFTLVELLISVALLGIILALGSPLMNNLTRVKEKQMIYVKMDNSMGKSIEIIKRSFRSAYTIQLDDGVKIQVSDNSKILENKLNNTPAISVSQKKLTINDTLNFNYNPNTKEIYVNSSTDDVIGENIEDISYIYSYKLNMLKINITMKIKDPSNSSGYITRTMSDVVQSRMASR